MTGPPADWVATEVKREFCRGLLGCSPQAERLRQRDATFRNMLETTDALRHVSRHHCRLGRTMFRVEVVRPLLCAFCAAEMHEAIPADGRAVGKARLCADCRARQAETRTYGILPDMSTTTPALGAVHCTHCQREVSGEPGANRQGHGRRLGPGGCQ